MVDVQGDPPQEGVNEVNHKEIAEPAVLVELAVGSFLGALLGAGDLHRHLLGLGFLGLDSLAAPASEPAVAPLRAI
jgi:hypothetical protein